MIVWTPERRALALASVARWQGTPHYNRIAICGVGVDCIKFVCEVLFDSGVLPRRDFTGYDLQSGLWTESNKLQDTILRCLNAVWVEDGFEFGDIFILKTGRRTAHCGFYTADGYIWHSLGNRCVTKSDFSFWRHEIRGMIRIKKEGFKLNPLSVRFD